MGTCACMCAYCVCNGLLLIMCVCVCEITNDPLESESLSCSPSAFILFQTPFYKQK